jgi:hypothetical protein
MRDTSVMVGGHRLLSHWRRLRNQPWRSTRDRPSCRALIAQAAGCERPSTYCGAATQVGKLQTPGDPLQLCFTLDRC